MGGEIWLLHPLALVLAKLNKKGYMLFVIDHTAFWLFFLFLEDSVSPFQKLIPGRDLVGMVKVVTSMAHLAKPCFCSLFGCSESSADQ